MNIYFIYTPRIKILKCKSIIIIEEKLIMNIYKNIFKFKYIYSTHKKKKKDLEKIIIEQYLN